MKKKIAILQSNYIPWKGYFDLIGFVDEFILYDDVLFTKNDWRNRNKIKTPHGTKWLTIPVISAGKGGQKINETKIFRDDCMQKHWKSLSFNYGQAKYFHEISSWLEPIYSQKNYINISELNKTFILAINDYLGINTIISNSTDYNLIDGQSERLLSLCNQAGASEYVSGPSAKNYLNEEHFQKGNVDVVWFEYNNYPEYPQLWGEFDHNVSILDLLFNAGKESPKYMRYVK